MKLAHFCGSLHCEGVENCHISEVSVFPMQFKSYFDHQEFRFHRFFFIGCCHQLAEDIDKLSLISEPYASYSYENTIQHHDASRSINRTHAGEHRLSKMDGNKLKRCFYCQMTKVRTRSGYRVKTTSHCVACEVPLCAGSTKCFQFYHELLKSSGHHVSSQGYHG